MQQASWSILNGSRLRDFDSLLWVGLSRGTDYGLSMAELKKSERDEHRRSARAALALEEWQTFFSDPVLCVFRCAGVATA